MFENYRMLSEPSAAEQPAFKPAFSQSLQIRGFLGISYQDMVSGIEEIMARCLQDPSADDRGLVVADLPTMERDPMRQAFAREKSAFERLLPDLLRQYEGRYVVVSNGAVADADPDRVALVQRFFTQHPGSPVFIGYVGSRRRPTRITRPFRR